MIMVFTLAAAASILAPSDIKSAPVPRPAWTDGVCEMETPEALGALMATGAAGSSAGIWREQQLPRRYTIKSKSKLRRRAAEAFTVRYGPANIVSTDGKTITIWNQIKIERPQLGCDGLAQVTMTDSLGKTTVQLDRIVQPIFEPHGFPKD